MRAGSTSPAPVAWTSVFLDPSAFTTLPAVVIMADFTMAGDQDGFLPRSSAPKPATCGAAMDVPDMKPKFAPPEPIGETPARTATPGADTSGFSRSDAVASSGPREEKPAICGWASSGRPVVSLFTRETLMPGLAVTLSWMVGTECWSVSREELLRFTRIMPTPPPRATSALLATRSTTPRSQTTTLPATFAGSSVPGPQSAGDDGGFAAAALAASTTPASLTSRFMMLAPRNLVPSANSTVPWSSWEKLLAATVVTQGAPWLTVLAVGPELPAEAATKMPVDAAFRKATETGSMTEVAEPEIE